jgi:hypothetical protein
MIDLGKIIVTMEASAYKEYAPGVLVVERLDGKGSIEIVPALSCGRYRVEMPITEKNIKLAKGFWLRRGHRVELLVNSLELPFDQEEYAKWKLEDDKAQDKASKELTALTKKLTTLTKSLQELEMKVDEEVTNFDLEKHKALMEKKPSPAFSDKYKLVVEKRDVCKAEIREISNQIETLKSEII